MNFLFACGGTGGHINPAVAAAQRIRALMPDAGILFVGAQDNMEMELVPREGFPIRGIPVGNLHRSLKPGEVLHNLRSAVLLEKGLRESGRILREFQPDAVLGTGGYVCYPVLRAASALGIPTLLHEANAQPGLTTRMLEKYTDRMMVAFQEGKSGYRDPDRVLTVGMPVRAGFRETDRAQARQRLGLDERPFLLSFGGSLGAFKLNAAVAALIAENEKTGAFRLLHAAGGGEEGMKAMRELLAQRGVTEPKWTEIRPYIYDMPQAMAAADLILCRAGASTLGELCAVGRGAILVPYPYATGNHQEKNARLLEKTGGARVLPDGELTGETLGALVRELVRDGAALREMGRALKSLDRPDSLDVIVEETLRLTEKKAKGQ
ncbi:MAG: undecaprenyldiphospho-muramoylpentapeptide beta-N-acetylglucosaminyltransferase [Oscillospiraceae bacterium]|nr:undecaprenyldiphospho-muramoylpentapeptide beta-N-acetylglucosaminyltransferase [Oscillospiraceae bacterium]